MFTGATEVFAEGRRSTLNHSRRFPLYSFLCALALCGCGGRFLTVNIPPRVCTSTSTQAAAECGPSMRFDWEKSNADISYPRALAQAGVAGSVTAAVWIGSLGIVDSVEVVSATRQQFAEAVKGTVKNWRFRPIGRNGTSGREREARERQVLPLEVLFRPGGCPEPQTLHQRAVALRTSLLVEIVVCGIRLQRTFD